MALLILKANQVIMSIKIRVVTMARRTIYFTPKD